MSILSDKLNNKIGQLQYEISLLGHDEETLTGVTIRTDELKEISVLTNEQIAITAHTVHLSYCKANGLKTQHIWSECSFEHRETVIKGVVNILEGFYTDIESSHNGFVTQKKMNGWVYGEKYSLDMRTNPRLVPFDELDHHQKVKEQLFFDCVNSFKLD